MVNVRGFGNVPGRRISKGRARKAYWGKPCNIGRTIPREVGDEQLRPIVGSGPIGPRTVCC